MLKSNLIQKGGHSSPLFILIVSHIGIVVLFAVLYYMIGQKTSSFNGVSHPMTFSDAIYFSMTTQSTAGYGDISPKTNTAKFVAMLQQSIILLEIIGIMVTSLGKN